MLSLKIYDHKYFVPCMVAHGAICLGMAVTWPLCL